MSHLRTAAALAFMLTACSPSTPGAPASESTSPIPTAPSASGSRSPSAHTTSADNRATPTQATSEEEAEWLRVAQQYYDAYNRAVATRNTTEFRQAFYPGSYTGETVADLLDRYAAVGTTVTGAVCTVTSVTASWHFRGLSLNLLGTVTSTAGTVRDKAGRVLATIAARPIRVSIGLERRNTDSPWQVVLVYLADGRAGNNQSQSQAVDQCGAMR